jgi:hypothetical protein
LTLWEALQTLLGVVAMTEIKINAVTVSASDDTTLSGVGLVYAASPFLRLDSCGRAAGYDGISHNDVDHLSFVASEAVNGCFQGIKSISNIINACNLDAVGSDDLASIANVIAALCDIGQDMNNQAQNFQTVLRKK